MSIYLERYDEELNEDDIFVCSECGEMFHIEEMCDCGGRHCRYCCELERKESAYWRDVDCEIDRYFEDREG